MRNSYAWRLAAAFAGVGLAAAVLTAILVNLSFGGLLNGYLGQQQQARQDQVVAILADAYQRHQSWDTAELDTLSPALAMMGAGVSLQDASGQQVWSIAGGSSGSMMGPMMGRAALGPPQRLPVKVDGTVVGTAFVSLPLQDRLAVNVAFRDAVNRLLLVGGLLGGLAALAIGLVFARRATVPVRDLTRAARQVASGDRAARVVQRSSDEFGQMAAAFNSMADTIVEEDRLRQTFAADIAHELRTPLMILSSQLEAMEDGVLGLGPDSITSLQEETHRLSKLVADLEVLASADAAHFSLHKERLDLAVLIAAVAVEFGRLFEAEAVNLDTELESTIVEGDPSRLRQILGNLLTNALKFTPRGGRVRIRLEREASRAIMKVCDSGPGIPQPELDRVFERFFRGHGGAAGGSGIGLTVVRELVAAHGGEVSAANAGDGGAVFTVTLPLAAGDQAASRYSAAWIDPAGAGWAAAQIRRGTSARPKSPCGMIGE
ncbi:MAG: sensor histidine kinase [Candidatus Dormibacteraceae bacterium]